MSQDLIGDLSDSLSEIRKELHNWKTKWSRVFVNHKPKSSTVVCCRERELCGFVHGDEFIIIMGKYVQWIWSESRLKEGLDFERCADPGVDDGVDKTGTILSRLATWNDQTGILPARMSMDGFDIYVVLCCGCEVGTSTPRNSLARTNQEFERYANVEILEFIHVCIAKWQTEEGPMKVMNSHRLTIFQGVKVEVAVFMMEPNEESMEHAQARHSMPCGCARESSCRRWLSRTRAWEEEYNVWSPLPQV